MQLSLISGVVSNERAEFELSRPLNLEPLIVNSKISNGQLRTAAGAEELVVGLDIDRGGINWNDVCYRVMGTRLVSVAADGFIKVLGDVGGDGPVGLDYSFDDLIVRSSGKLFYWNMTLGLRQITDEDLGRSIDAIWIDGYTMSTDGRYVVVTELNDPMQVKPLKYGSAEADPDPVTGLIKVTDEAYVIGRHTIQVFQNVGGNGFPFQTIKGATIPYGSVSANAKTRFGRTFAFVGSARDEALGVYVAGQGTANKISDRVVDDWLSSIDDPTSIVCERRASRDELRLLVHGPDRTWIFLAKATEAAGEPIWYQAQSGRDEPYRLRNAVNVYGKTMVSDLVSARIGYLTTLESTHFDSLVEWSFDVGLVYNQAKGAIIDRVELVGLPGRGDDSAGTSAFMSISYDGTTWSTERAVSLGSTGTRNKRIQWRPHARMRSYMGFRFRGYTRALAGFATCEATARPLSV